MASSLPAELLESDARLHALHAAIPFSRYLNPVNIPEAREAFTRGAEAPPFRYAPADWAADALDALDRLRVPALHPLGAELGAVAAETRALILALRDRTRERFDALAELCDWLPEPAEALGEPAPRGPLWAEIPVEDLQAALREALAARGLRAWEVVWDPVMASRVLVDSVRRQVRVNPAARFRDSDRIGLVAHEIDVHVTRGENGRDQPLHLFSTGLARSLGTEEGLAILAEERVGTLSASFLPRQALVAEAVLAAGELGFRGLYEWLQPRAGGLGAWQIALRVKRGLGEPAAPGVYAKDTVYLRGFRRVRGWLAAGGDMSALYVGKVGVDHPVGDWLAAGWVRPRSVPAIWLNPPR